MSAPDLLIAMREAGMTVTVIDGRLHVTGPTDALDRFRPSIRMKRDDLILAAKVGASKTAVEPFDREAFEERAAICEFDGGLSREDAEAIAWQEDDRRRCTECNNLTHAGVCRVATPGGLVSANRGYRPVLDPPRRCVAFVSK